MSGAAKVASRFQGYPLDRTSVTMLCDSLHNEPFDEIQQVEGVSFPADTGFASC
jgi:hypothetical protein